jgi:glycogen phosphorylase
MSSVEPFLARTHIAYFSMEIAVRPEMHTYSGGLGILAGDTARSCADLELPVVFVSLLSRAGYFRQELDPAGQQIEHPDWWEIEPMVLAPQCNGGSRDREEAGLD